MLQKPLHPHQLAPLRELAPQIARRHVLPERDPPAHFRDLGQFPRAVFGEDGARFLEALVGHLFEGDVVGGEDGGAAAAGADGVDAGAEELALFEGGGDGVGVEVWWRGWGGGGGCCWFEGFIFSLGGGCEAVGRA